MKKPSDLPALVLDIPGAGQRPTLEIRGDCKTIVDWINGHAKLKTRECTVEKTQNTLPGWWGRGVHLRQRTADWATHVFREHNKEADLWADKGPKGRVEEWVDTARVVWSEVIGLCGDGSCDNGNCGAGKLIMACSDLQGWFPIYKKMRAGSGSNSLGAELGRCGMLTYNLCQWIGMCVRLTTYKHQDYCGCVSRLPCIFWWSVLHAGGPLPRPLSLPSPVPHHHHHPVSCPVGGSGSGVRDSVVLGIGGTRICLPCVKRQ